jgi:TolB-like protein/Tfp pilus assembly protein PilF
MASLLAELRRRNVFRVGFAYIVVGWVVLQVAEFLSPLLQLPTWTVSFALYLGIIGFPFALLFAWAFELTPDGLRRTQDVDPDASITHETASKLNRVTITLMGIAIVLLLGERLINQPGQDAENVASVVIAESVESVPVEAAQGKPKSIAVLPFVNMSNDPEQEYFSDGISEELLNALANIRDLRVAARTSSFAFKGQNQDISVIGEQLNVATILEGSVRKSGQRLRITAQLISVEDGYHLWSETYDRDLTDIFAIQDEISAAIVNELKVHLGQGEAVYSSKAVNLEAYNFYLLGRHSLRERTERSLERALKEFQKAIEVEPAYADAWAGKATATILLSVDNYGSLPAADAYQNAQAMLDVAFGHDPDCASAHATQALLYSSLNLPRESLASADRAIELNPNEGILYAWRYNALYDLGNYNAALASLERAYEVDPLHPVIRSNLARAYGSTLDVEKARELVAPDTAPAYELAGIIATAEGRWADAVINYRKALQLEEGNSNPQLKMNLTVIYFFKLKNTDLAMQTAGPLLQPLLSAFLDPMAFLANNPYGELRAANIFALISEVIALHRTGQCPQILALLRDKGFENIDIVGSVDGGASDALLALQYAMCLKSTGATEQSRALGERLLALVEKAVANGQPPDYFDFLALTQMLLDDQTAAIYTLHKGLQHYDIDWTDLSLLAFDSLRSDKDFQEIEQALEDHTNSERAKLGWDPIQLRARMSP